MKTIIKHLILMFVIILGAACSAPVKEGLFKADSGESIELLNFLPKSIEGFSYELSHLFTDSLDYSLRYRNNMSGRTYADVYMYPVPEEALGHEHEDRVIIMTNSVLRSIDMHKKAGGYSEIIMLDENTFSVYGRIAMRVDLFLVKNNLNIYSLIFLTESNDKFIKIRMTMPDNAENRNDRSWQAFVDKIFLMILRNIEKA